MAEPGVRGCDNDGRLGAATPPAAPRAAATMVGVGVNSSLAARCSLCPDPGVASLPGPSFPSATAPATRGATTGEVRTDPGGDRPVATERPLGGECGGLLATLSEDAMRARRAAKDSVGGAEAGPLPLPTPLPAPLLTPLPAPLLTPLSSRAEEEEA